MCPYLVRYCITASMISIPAGLFRVTIISNQKPLITVPNERTLIDSFTMFLRIICIYLELLRAGRPSDIQEMSKCLRLALEDYFAGTARTTLRTKSIDVDKLFTT